MPGPCAFWQAQPGARRTPKLWVLIGKVKAKLVGNGAGAPPAKLAEVALVAARAAKRYPLGLLARSPEHGALQAKEEFTAGWSASAHAVSWLGHCTVLLKVHGQTILTDPVWSRRIGLSVAGRTIGISRLHPPPVSIEALPAIDLVLLSHAHFDHLDLPTLRHLLRVGGKAPPRVITAANTAGLIPKGFAQVDELGCKKSIQVGDLLLRAIEPKHWGARAGWDRHRGFNSYLLGHAGGDGPRVLFAGDTAMTGAYDHLGANGVDLAIMGIGAYDPWVRAHATPEQVWQMSAAMRARRVLPVHFGTFKLSDEPPDEPMARLLAAAGSDHPRILGPALGHVHQLPG